MGETKILAQYIASLSYRDLPQRMIEKAKELILDQFGCEMVGSGTPWGRLVFQHMQENRPSSGKSTVVRYGLRTRPEDAAFVNATFGHAFEIDDTELVSKIHCGSAIIPAALAVAEREQASGETFLTAVIIGYDVASRIGAACRQAIARGFHSTGIFTPFGAAAAAARILGLDASQTLNCLGIVASSCSGLSEYTQTGGAVKRIHAALAAESGVRSAFLARGGLTAPSTILEGKRGFCRAFAGECELDQITAELRKGFRIEWTGLKPYCCCAAQHAALDAISMLVTKHDITLDMVEQITVGSGASEMAAVGVIDEPTDLTAMQFSGRFGIALRLLKGGNTLGHYTEANLWDPQVRSFAKRIEWVRDEEVEKTTEAGARVTVRLTDGRNLSEKVDWAKGTIHNPMTNEEVRQKFRELASSVVAEQQVKEIEQLVYELESLDDLSRLTRLLVASHQP